MISRVLAMVAAEREVRPILDELLGSQGASLHVRSNESYVAPGECASFFCVAKRAQAMGQILVGYQDGSGTHINPGTKTEDGAVSCPPKHQPMAWVGKQVIVLIVVDESETAKIQNVASTRESRESRCSTRTATANSESVASFTPQQLKVLHDMYELDAGERASLLMHCMQLHLARAGV